MKSDNLVSAKNLEMKRFERALDIRNPNSCFEKTTTLKQKATEKTIFKIQVNIIGGKTTKKSNLRNYKYSPRYGLWKEHYQPQS